MSEPLCCSPARGLLEPGDLASLRWLRGEGGVLDAVRDEMRHVLGLTQREVREGARPRRVSQEALRGARTHAGGLEAVDARDLLEWALRGLSVCQREALLDWAAGVPQEETRARWGVAKGTVGRHRDQALAHARGRATEAGLQGWTLER